jgi:phosphatidylglycerophosphate synthase
MTARTGLVRAGAAGCLVLAAAGFALRLVLPTGEWFPYKASGVFAALIGFMLPFVGDHPFHRLGPANRVTLVRAMFVALATALIGEPATARLAWMAIAAGVISIVLDGADGWLARRGGMASAFGGRFDMEADALLIMALSVLVWQHHKAGPWVLACGLMRYAFVAGGWWLPWLAGRLTPTQRGRLVAVGQVVGLGVALMPVVRRPASDLVALVTLAALISSFALDVGRLWRQGSTD